VLAIPQSRGISRDFQLIVAERIGLIQNFSPVKKARFSAGFRGDMKFVVFLAVGGYEYPQTILSHKIL